jgi:glyoxylase-like metal-dependent hydrolase (beta-lactamase superfamily II)
MHRVTRRTFLKDLGKGVFAIVVGGPVLAACASDEVTGVPDATAPPAPGTTAAPMPSTSAPATTLGSRATDPPATSAPATTHEAPTIEPTTIAPTGTTLQRINLGNVSAYALARGSEVAVVDTGVPGSAGQIEVGLAEIGLNWGNVGYVILTHLHNDHIGSLAAVMAAATEADGYAGAADIPAMSSPRPLTAVGDGDTVFDMDVIETPGHTEGHICVLDTIGGILVAGDALNGDGGGVVGPNSRFTPDMTTAHESVKKLAGFSYETVVFGHGEPVMGGASEQVAALAATL